MRELIMAGHSNPAIAEIIRREFSGTKTNARTVAVYRSVMRQEVSDVPRSVRTPKLVAVSAVPKASAAVVVASALTSKLRDFLAHISR